MVENSAKLLCLHVANNPIRVLTPLSNIGANLCTQSSCQQCLAQHNGRSKMQELQLENTPRLEETLARTSESSLFKVSITRDSSSSL
jgi:hypothetical protein